MWNSCIPNFIHKKVKHARP
uniref:Uncharacterized protein n=1 Tax=Rhizophora mucronata TaxID=61149 RepID=A0A2P2N2E3_RHIMU